MHVSVKARFFIICLIFSLCSNFALASRKETCLIITDTGKVLYQNNAKSIRYPASLTKMMTIYLVFDALKNNRITMDSKIVLSKRAAAMPQMKLGIGRGARITVKDAILSLIIRSSNDIAVALAENISGTEEQFAVEMNRTAQRLGMTNTRFTNASGWHHNHQVTTAYDMAKLAIALKRDFEEFYHLFARSSFYYKDTFYKSHNYVVHHLDGAEGLKTGYTSKAGWNIVTAAKRDNVRLIGVILGGKTPMERDVKMMRLMNDHFQGITNVGIKGGV